MNRNLTPRERQILEYASNGLSHKQIATELGVAVLTIKNHNIITFYKLDAKNMPHAVAIWIRQGIIK
jgi:DNA-binding NarL/FixJ family response regulator